MHLQNSEQTTKASLPSLYFTLQRRHRGPFHGLEWESMVGSTLQGLGSVLMRRRWPSPVSKLQIKQGSSSSLVSALPVRREGLQRPEMKSRAWRVPAMQTALYTGEDTPVWSHRRRTPGRVTMEPSSETLTNLTIAQDIEFHFN